MAGGSNFLIPRLTKSSETYEDGHSKQLVFHGTSSKSTQPHPSTSRALVLRKVAYGSGELALSRKVSGQEKLTLLASEMMTNAIRVPFRMDGLLKMAESQLGVHLDEISNLKDPDFFCDDILITINTRIESIPDKNGLRRPPINDSRWVASVVGCRIHNVYLLAGAWRIVRNALRELEAMALDDADVRGQLRADEKMRTRYLLLYDIVTLLARMGQQRLASIAAATAHYAPYFVRRNTANQNSDMEFDHHGNNPRKIREAHRSFIDAIILELVLPNSEYPPYVLMALLHNAVEECRKEEKRFSQALWDAVGDFSVTVEVLDILEGPLSGTEGESWIKDTSMRTEFIEFLRVQALSHKASQNIDSWKSSLESISETKKEHVLRQLWYNIDKTYRQVCGVTIDDLWSLQSDLHRSPQWSTYFIPGLTACDSDPDQRAVVLHKRAKQNQSGDSQKKHLLLEDSAYDPEMPALISASDSSDEIGHPESSDEEEMSEGDSESDYDPAEDELMHDLLQEALETVIEMDLLEKPEDYTPSAEKLNSNPFTRMLANLKDRFFSANPVLRADERSRNPFKARPAVTPSIPSTSQVPISAARARPRSPLGQYNDSDLPDLEPIRPLRKPIWIQPDSTVQGTLTSMPPLEPLDANSRRFQQSIIEEVEDEDDVIETKKKKKKKKKKTSKKPQETLATSQSPPVLQSVPASSSPSAPRNTAKESAAEQSPSNSSITNSMGALDKNSSRTSLPLPIPAQSAQSARSYLHSENLTTEKAKVKTRPAFARSFFKPEREPKKHKEGDTEKRGFLGRMKPSFKNIPKGVSDSVMQLISSAGGKKPMKWEKFLKVMQGMGFSCDPSTAGSSVRFDPPDPRDPPITFHKPHPDSTLQKTHLRQIGKRLKRNYGWRPEQFSIFGVGENDEDSD